MRFDKTFVAIRARGTFEIFDLALHVLRQHLRALVCLLILGFTPWVLLDWCLVSWALQDEQYNPLFYFMMLVLIVSQAQIGTLFIVHYLGQAMFAGRPKIWETVWAVLRNPWYMLWSHGGLRMVFPTLFCCLLFSPSDEDILIAGIIFTSACAAIGLLVRGMRPFVSEIVLLEKTPISRRNENEVYFAERSKSLHVHVATDLVGRFALAFLVACCMTFSCFSFFVIVDGVFNFRADSEISFLPYYWTVSLVIVAGFVAVPRFLSYIDTRIRQEGWAVELRMRAQGQLLREAID